MERDHSKRLERLWEFLESKTFDAGVLARPVNIAAFFHGAETSLGFRQEPPGRVAVCLTARGVTLIGNRTEVTRVKEDELSSIPGLAVRPYRWDEWNLRASVLDYLDSDEIDRVCDDIGFFGEDVSVLLQDLYYPLSEAEVASIRTLAQDAARAVESVGRSITRGATEAQIAGALTGRLVSEGIRPELVMVAVDGRIGRLRHCMPKDVGLEQLALLSVTVHRQGLYVSLTRIVSLGPPPDAWRRWQEVCNHVDASTIAASVSGARVGSVFQTMLDSYAAYGYDEEWMEHHQGGPAGFCGRDYKATLDCERCLVERQPIVWNPTVRGAKSEDTILTKDARQVPEILTHTDSWVYNEVAMEHGAVLRPAILAV